MTALFTINLHKVGSPVLEKWWVRVYSVDNTVGDNL